MSTDTPTMVEADQADTAHAPANASLATRLEVLDTREAYEEDGGEYKFAGTLVVYRDGGDVYHAISKARGMASPELIMELVTSKTPIPTAAYRPRFPSTYTRAPDPLPCDTYVKRPSLMSYDRVCKGALPNSIADGLLAEAQVYELLRRNPHPNIARYLGCRTLGDDIDGLCLARYGTTLMQAANPHSFMKRKLSATRQGLGLGDYGHMLDGIESGLKHLHSLGLVHNDVNPSNIMRDGDDWVLIDFGSCRRMGENLDHVGRTYEWYDEAVKESLPTNDLDALREIRTWLEGGRPDAFQFDE